MGILTENCRTIEVGRWAINKEGKMFKIQMILHSEGKPTTLLLRFLDNSQKVIGYHEWQEHCIDDNLPANKK